MRFQDREQMVLIVLAGLVGSLFLYRIINIQLEEVPVMAVAVIWVAISGIVKDMVEQVRWSKKR